MNGNSNPGDVARQYAVLNGWTLRPRNIMVEGDKDVRYFQLASRINEERTGMRLLDGKLSVFSPGTGDKGGVPGVCEQFWPLRKVIDTDLDSNGKGLFRIIAVFDNDPEGRKGLEELARRHRSLRVNRDLFLLQRKFPRQSSEPSIVAKHIVETNAKWSALECTIEDLLSDSFLRKFAEANANSLQAPPIEIEGQKHYKWTPHGKDQLAEFARHHATIDDVAPLLEALKGFRHYLGLPAGGTAQR
jgi:hypothetical protein